MRLKNYQEDVVLHAIEIALEDKPDLRDDEVAVKDIAAYVLNRLPPRYIMSERGFTRFATEQLEPAREQESMANMITVLMLVNRGIEVVEERRSPASVGGNGAQRPTVVTPPDLSEEALPVHNFPQIIGKVIDAGTDEPIEGATVTLYIDGEAADSADAGWPNPFVTARKTYGYFSFWPAPVRDGEERRDFRCVAVVEHPDYEPEQLESVLSTRAEFDVRREIDGDTIFRMGTCGLRR